MAEGLKVLVADDSVVVRRVLVAALQATGKVESIDEVSDGPGVVTMMTNVYYDIVFCDIYMPGSSGLEAVCMVKMAKKEENRKMPFVIFMSTDVSRDLQMVAEQMGAFEFLTKPFRQKEIDSLIDLYKRLRTPTRVLVVDDSSTVRRLIEKILDRSEFTLIFDEADRGSEALEKIEKRPYAAVFLDVNMPNMDGFQTLALMKAAQPALQVVLMSAEPRNSILIRAGSFTIDGFLTKPFKPREVDMVLYNLFDLNAPRLAQQRLAVGGG